MRKVVVVCKVWLLYTSIVVVCPYVMWKLFHYIFLPPQKTPETEDQQTEVVANPEQYIKHPLQNKWE